jgi:hypothetical protein
MEPPLYTVVYDVGKPYEKIYHTKEELINALKAFFEKRFYEMDEYPFDIFVYNAKGEDISETKIIKDIMSEIIDEIIYTHEV